MKRRECGTLRRNSVIITGSAGSTQSRLEIHVIIIVVIIIVGGVGGVDGADGLLLLLLMVVVVVMGAGGRRYVSGHASLRWEPRSPETEADVDVETDAEDVRDAV